MNIKQIEKLIRLLKEKGISFDKGLTNEELSAIEQRFKINFPKDLRSFLKTKLPVSEGFIHWRYGLNSEKGKKNIESRLNWPLEGILFDVKNNECWLKEWGMKPKTYSDQKEMVISNFKNYPKLIPIYLHRYISSEPSDSGNPVFSVYQTDIIYYGVNLVDYFSNEFNLQLSEEDKNISFPKTIDFWTKMIEKNNE